MTLPFSIGILSWKSPKTLHQTLASYKENGLLDLTDDVAIYFQEISKTDLAIAEEFGITKIYGGDRNVGIGAAFTTLVEGAKYEQVLILEEDWVLVESNQMVEEVIKSCIAGLVADKIDFIRLRHVRYPGDPLYTRQFKGREMDSPEHLLDAVHWHGGKLVELYPAYLYAHHMGDYFGELWGFVCGDSFYCNHTNNAHMTTKSFYKNNITPFSGNGVALEGSIRDTWRSAGHRVAHSIPGLFSHQRIDR